MLKRIIFIIFIIILVGYIWAVSQTRGFSNGKDKLFVIERGQGVHEISYNLKQEGFIKNSFIFETYVWAKKVGNKFQAGEYALNTGADIAEITKILTSGHVLSQEREIKILEGWNINDMAEYLENEKIAPKAEFLKIVSAENWKSAFFGGEVDLNSILIPSEIKFLANIPEGKSLEGFLFPDTYRIYKNAAPVDISEKMLTNFGLKLDEKIVKDIENQGKNFYEIITMASIIQKEVAKTEDMKMVSDIFWRRIGVGMPLQSCATIAYILGENKEQYSYEDTRIESPYNTYLNSGLPPTPICNPGLAAITAAIYPEKNEYWYFLSKSDTGETVFSKTLEEHNINKEKYLK